MIPLTFAILALGLPHWLSVSLLAGFSILVFLLDIWFFSRPQTHAQKLAALETKGLVEYKTYQAKRAFSIEGINRNGAEYYLELVDGSVLYLVEECLKTYEPHDSQPRRFPCTEFEIGYHKLLNTVVDVKPAGATLEPELILPQVWVIQDPPPRLKSGEILRGNYEAIKQQEAERMGETSALFR